MSKSIKGIEAAGKFPYGFMSEENRNFLINNVSSIFEATRVGINGYELHVKLSSGKPVMLHLYNGFEMSK